MLTNFLGVPKQIEILTIIVTGIVVLLFDSSLFHVKSDVEAIWKHDYGRKLQENGIDALLKYVLSGVVFVRGFTVHAFLAFYIVMLWPVVFVERPNLMIPWLVIGSVRSVIANFVTLLTGMYACATEKGGLRLICFDFILSQVIQHAPAVYAWLSVYYFYRELKIISDEEKERNQLIDELTARRKRIKSLTCSSFDDRVDDGRNLISESTIDSIIHCLQSDSSLSPSRSLDTLLSLLSIEETKDEIMSIDTLSDDGQTKSLSETALATVSLHDDEIDEIKLKKDIMVFRKLSNCGVGGVINTDETHELNTNQHTENMLLQEVNNMSNKVEPKENRAASTSNKTKCLCKYSNSFFQDEVVLRCISLNNYSKVSVEPQNRNSYSNSKEKQLLAKKNVLENSQEDCKVKKQNFECQVNTISRIILEQPPEEVTKKFRIAKQIILEQFT